MKFKKISILVLIIFLLMPSISYGEKINSKVYLIVANKITLKDIEKMDNVQSMIKQGSIGLMNTKGTTGYTGAESFLTINASQKAYANYASIEFENSEHGIINQTFSKVLNLNLDNKHSPYIGAVGDNLHKVGKTTGIYGSSDLIETPMRLSALIPMDSKGIIDYGVIENITLEDNDYSFKIKTDYERLLEEVIKSPADFIVIDTGDLDRIYRYSEFLSEEEFIKIRKDILIELDLFIKSFLDSVDKDNSLVMLTSPNSGDINVYNSRLAPMILWGKEIEPNTTLISGTTNRKSIISNTDIAPTIMSFLGAPMDNISQNKINVVNESIDLSQLIKLNDQIVTMSTSRSDTLYYYSVFSMAVMAIGILLTMRKIRLSSKGQEILNLFFKMIIVLPILFIVVSNLRPTTTFMFNLSMIISIMLGFILVHLSKNINNQMKYISAIGISIIIIDLITRGMLSKFSVLSHDPIIGARYYGIGNEMIGLFLALVCIFALDVKYTKLKNNFVLGLFAICVLLVGHPVYGANVGGTMAFVIATMFFILESFQKQINIKNLFIIAISVVAIVMIMGYIDIRFNENPTHLGSTILLIKDKGIYQIYDIISRKLLVNIRLIGSSYWTNILIFNLFLHGVLFDYKKDNIKLNKSYIAGITGAIGGFLLNDSGLLLTAICINLMTARLYLKHIEEGDRNKKGEIR